MLLKDDLNLAKRLLDLTDQRITLHSSQRPRQCSPDVIRRPYQTCKTNVSHGQKNYTALMVTTITL